MKTGNPWIEFWKKFARMLDGGIPILATLQTLGTEMEAPAIRETCRLMHDQVKEGHTISSAMERLPNLFTPSVLKMIQAGELSGTLDKAMLSVAAGIGDGSFQSPASDTALPVADQVAPSPTPAGQEPAATDELPVLRIIGQILKDAFEQKASDIHIESTAQGLRLRYRQDGVLRSITPPSRELADQILSRFKIMANVSPTEKRLPQDGRIMVNIQGKEVDLRASFYPTVKGESLVLRVLNCNAAVVALDRIIEGDQLNRVRTWLAEPRGLLISNGPTGSGKTTTLYAMLAACDAERHKIITVEEPVEHQLDGVCQQQARYAQGLTIAAGLRSILRQDADIIMATEIRDLETVQILIQGALTGHLMMSSLHADHSLNAVRRLLDIGIEPFLIHGAPVRIISQRLYRRICRQCKQEIAPEPWMRDFFPADAMPVLYKGNGCDSCHGTGFRGRGAAHELFEPSYDLVARLAKGATPAELTADARAAGLVTMRVAGLAKVIAGETTLQEILRVTPPDAA